MAAWINSLLFDIAHWAEDGLLGSTLAHNIYALTELLP